MMKWSSLDLPAFCGTLTPPGPPLPPALHPSRERGEGRQCRPTVSDDHLTSRTRAGFRRRSVALAGGALLAGLMLPLLGCGGGDDAIMAAPTNTTSSGETSEKVVPVTTLVTTSREVVERTSLPADLLPLRRAVLAAETAGTVEKVHVDEGDRAAAGRILVEIDTRALRQRLSEAEAVERHRGVLFQRAEKLLAKKSITEQQYLDAVTERDVAAAQLATIRLALDQSRITAPWAGTVAVRRVEVGDYVVPGQPVVELLDLRRLKVRAPAPAKDVPYLRRGLAAEVRLDVYPGEVWNGEITRLAAELDTAARTLDVDVEVTNPDGRLRPGMYARLEIPRRTLADAVLVPLAAIVDLENERVVYVALDGRAERRSVELGAVLGDEVVIATGLEAGEQLIVEGQHQVSPGQRITEATGSPDSKHSRGGTSRGQLEAVQG